MALPPHRPPRSEPLTCPVDGARLHELERGDVLIDACPTCRGVWLDRGELDRLIEADKQAPDAVDEDFLAEMSGTRRPAGAPGGGAAPSSGGGSQQLKDLAKQALDAKRAYDHAKYGGHGHHKKKKRKSVLEELFDF